MSKEQMLPSWRTRSQKEGEERGTAISFSVRPAKLSKLSVAKLPALPPELFEYMGVPLHLHHIFDREGAIQRLGEKLFLQIHHRFRGRQVTYTLVYVAFELTGSTTFGQFLNEWGDKFPGVWKMEKDLLYEEEGGRRCLTYWNLKSPCFWDVFGGMRFLIQRGVDSRCLEIEARKAGAPDVESLFPTPNK